MEAIVKAHERLEKKANLKRGIQDVQEIIDKLKTARRTVEAGTSRNTDSEHGVPYTSDPHAVSSIC